MLKKIRRTQKTSYHIVLVNLKRKKLRYFIIVFYLLKNISGRKSNLLKTYVQIKKQVRKQEF
jgi:hypothetical protein